MRTQTAKSAKRSTKTTARTAKKSVKTVKSAAKRPEKRARKPEKSARGAQKGAEKQASKAARSPVGKSAEKARTIIAAARTSKVEIKPAAPPNMIRTVSPPTQPVAPEIVLKSHRYQVGETVYFTSPTFGRAAASGTYTVVKLLPSESDDYQYRIKSSGEAFERVAKESQLDKL
jgi:hypothetical protein